MPNLSAHYIVGKKVSNNLFIDSNEFTMGTIYPDYIDNSQHFKTRYTHYDVPDINLFLSKVWNLNDFFKGYLTHLLLDYYFLEEYLPSIGLTEPSIFNKDGIYMDYTIISSDIVNFYNIDTKDIENIFKNELVDLKKFNKDIEFLKLQTNSTPMYLDKNSYICFLEEVSLKITNYILSLEKQYIKK